MRVAALRTCAAYWRVSHGDSRADTDKCDSDKCDSADVADTRADVRIVAAGLEPQRFTDLFDTWEDHDQAADANIAVSIIIIILY